MNFLEVFKFKEGSTNNTNWEDPKYIDLLDRSAVCKDSSERKRILREAEGLSYEEISEAMGCSLDSVKARLKRARAELLEMSRHFSGSDIV